MSVDKVRISQQPQKQDFYLKTSLEFSTLNDSLKLHNYEKHFTNVFEVGIILCLTNKICNKTICALVVYQSRILSNNVLTRDCRYHAQLISLAIAV